MGRKIGVSVLVEAGLQPSVVSTFSTVESRVKALKGNMKDLQAVSARAAALSTADAQLKAAQAAAGSNPTDTNKKALVSAQKAYNSAERAAKKYNITVADAAKVHAKATSEMARTEAALKRQEVLQNNQARRKELQGQMLGTVASFAAVAAPVKLAIDFESVMADVKKVTNFDAPGWAKFSDDLLLLSTRIPMSAKGLAEIAAAAGQAGIAEEEMLRFVEDAAVMAVAFGISAEEAGSAMTGLRTNFKLNQDGVISLGDAINQLANNMDATAGEIINFSTRAGRVGTQFGFTGEQISALGAAMIAMKMPAEVASRAVNSMMMKLGTADALGKDAQEAFARLGFSGKEMAKAFKEDGQGAMIKFLEAVQRSDDPIRDLKAILGEGFADEIAGLVGGLDEYKKALGLIDDQTSYSGSMLAEYTTRAATTENALDLMKNSAARLGIILGSTILPAIAAVANGVVKLLEPVATLAAKFPNLTRVVFGVVFALAALKLVTLGGKYAATFISDGWTIAKGVFASLRPRVIAAKVALLAHKAAAVATAVASKAVAAGQALVNGVMAIARSRFVATTVAMVAHRAISLALAAGMKIVTAAQWLLNTAMMANPIGLIIMAVAGLVAGFVYLYKKSETFRNVLGAIGKVAKIVFAPLILAWKAVKAVWGAASGFFSKVWGGIKSAASKVWGGIKDAASNAWEGIKLRYGPAISFFGKVWDGVKSVASSAWEGIKQHASNSWEGIKEIYSGTTSFFGSVWDGIKSAGSSCFDWMGEKFDWVKSKFQWISDGWSTVKGWFGFGDDEESEDSAAARETASQAAQEAASTAASAAATPAAVGAAAAPVAAAAAANTPTVAAPPVVSGAPSGAAGLPASAPAARTAPPPAAAPQPGAVSGGLQLSQQLSMPVNFYGVPSGDVGDLLLQAIKNKEPEIKRYFARLLEGLTADQRRVAYEQ